MKKFTTMSDAGGLKVGTKDFNIIIPNGYGDGDTLVRVLEESEKAPSTARFFTSIEGENINVYAYDCGQEVETTLSGRYGVYIDYNEALYSNQGNVYLEKWGA